MASSPNPALAPPAPLLPGAILYRDGDPTGLWVIDDVAIRRDFEQEGAEPFIHLAVPGDGPGLEPVDDTARRLTARGHRLPGPSDRDSPAPKDPALRSDAPAGSNTIASSPFACGPERSTTACVIDSR